ncbi:MAG TPA: TonB-dependent receptor, partial [Prevotella sp.]
SSMYIRGIGSRVNSPAVGIYVDGMPIMSKAAFNFHTYQLERVDVLRGPQGTLYGQNTEGGLVRMYSRNPMNYQGTDLSLSAGTHFYRNAELAHYAKFSDKLALSIAGFYGGQNGFFRNTHTGDRADSYNEAGGKMRLVWRPAERWDINLLADYQYVRQNAFPYGLLDQATGIAEAPATTFQSNYRRNMLNTALNLKFRGNYFDFNSMTSYQYMKDYMLMDQDYLPQDYMHLEQRQFQNTFVQEFALKSNRPSAWQWTTGAFFSAQWLRTDGPVYFGEAMTQPIGNAIQASMYKAMVSSMAAGMMAQGMPAAAATAAAQARIEKAGGVSLDVTMGSPGVYHTPQYNLGFFHESSIRLSARLRATLGLRYDYSHVDIDYNASAFMNMHARVMGREATTILSSALKHDTHNNYNQLLPKVGLSYLVGQDGSNVYATMSKGYRAGGYNIQMFSDVLQTELNKNSGNVRQSLEIPHTLQDYENVNKTIAYEPETSWNYELGAHLNLFGNRVHADFSAYYMSVHNQQISVMAGNYGFGRRMVNAGKSHSCGVEASLSGILANDHLSWALSYAYTHAIFDEYSDTLTVGSQKTFVDYKDCKVPYVPQHTFAASADYRIDFSNSALRSITLGANVAGAGKIYWDEQNSYSQKIYAVLGAHADADFGRVKLSVWGRNLTDTKYNTFAVSSAAAREKLTFSQRGTPIQFGADLKLHF